jgi:hypothetical protein
MRRDDRSARADDQPAKTGILFAADAFAVKPDNPFIGSFVRLDERKIARGG